MGTRLPLLRSALPLLIGVLALGPVATARASSSFQLGLQDPGFGAPASTQSARIADTTLRQIDGSFIRIAVNWAATVGYRTTMPAGFDPSDPGDPDYNWSATDAAVRAAARLHAAVLLTLYRAPQWAEGPNPASYTDPYAHGAWDPSPADFALFAHAAAARYSGRYLDPLHPGSYLPRVKYWEIWNEENLPIYLAAPDLVGEYRALLDAGYGAIKGVIPGSVIVAGGLAPVSYLPPLSLTPLQFGAELLCLQQAGGAYVPAGSCPQPAEFDVFAIHPYSLAATPTKHAYTYGNVLVGDMGEVKALVAAADRLHTAAPRIHHQIWVNEWAWFTDPPNTIIGDPPRVAARYVAYSLYEMWRSGVSVVIWQNAQDTSTVSDPGGGLYTASGTPKPMLYAFAFPFVASVMHGTGFAWGRVPVSHSVKVRVQRLSGRHWRTVATALTGARGVFEVDFRAHGNAFFRAQVIGGPTSLGYDSHPIPPVRTHLLNTG